MLALDGDSLLVETNDDLINSSLDSASQVHGVHAGGDGLAALLEDEASEDSGGGGTITSLVVNLGGNLLDEGGTNVVVAILELDILGDSDTILGDLWHAKSAVEDDVAATGSKGNLNGIGESVDALEHECARISSELDVLGEVSLGLGQESAGSGRVLNGLHLV